MGVPELSWPSDRVRSRPAGMTLAELWLSLALLLPFVAALVSPLSTVDLAYAVRAGELMLDNGGLLRSDPFTFSAGGTSWVDQQWAGQILLAMLFRAGGWALVALVRAAIVTLIVGFVVGVARRLGFGLLAASRLALVGFLLASPALAMRTQLLGLLLFAVATWSVAGQVDRRRLWLLPPLALVWANVHGSFVLAPAMAAFALANGIRAGRAEVERGHGYVFPLVILALTLGATFVTPFGPSVWTYAAGLAADPRIRALLVEWQPTSVFDPLGFSFYASLTVATIALGLRCVRVGWRTVIAQCWPDLLWLAGLAFLGASAVRGIAWWAIGGLPVVAALALDPYGRVARLPAEAAEAADGESGVRQASASAPKRRARRPLLANTVLAGVVVVVGVLALPLWRSTDPTGGALPLLSDAPRSASDAVARLSVPGTRLAVPQRWASWFELSVPARPVFVDSRVEVVPAAAWDDYAALAAGRDVPSILDRWRVDIVVVDVHTQVALVDAMSLLPKWTRAFADSVAAVFVRSGP